MSYKITEIEGIGPTSAEKLAAAKITTTDHLLDRCCTANGRTEMAKMTGIGESTILKWANMADMMRVSGIGGQYAELLKAAGVDTVKELRTRNAENLATKLTQINAEKKLTKGSASSATVQAWIEKAKDIEPKITH